MVADHEAESDHEANLPPAAETEPGAEIDPTLLSDPLYLYLYLPFIFVFVFILPICHLYTPTKLWLLLATCRDWTTVRNQPDPSF